jgi:hypothetical protein
MDSSRLIGSNWIELARTGGRGLGWTKGTGAYWACLTALYWIKLSRMEWSEGVQDAVERKIVIEWTSVVS